VIRGDGGIRELKDPMKHVVEAEYEEI